MKPFENPGKLANDPRGMTYGKAAALAAGALAIAYYNAQRRDTRGLPTNNMNSDVLCPDVGTTQQVATNCEQQQHRKVPPTTKETRDERS